MTSKKCYLSKVNRQYSSRTLQVVEKITIYENSQLAPKTNYLRKW